MEYNIICKNKEEFENKLNKYLKVELVDNTDNYFPDGKLERFQTICGYINYDFTADAINNNNNNNNTNLIDKGESSYMYHIMGEYYINDNTLYFNLLPKPKYYMFLDMFNNLTIEHIFNFNINLDKTKIDNDIKDKLGQYKITIVDNYENIQLP